MGNVAITAKIYPEDPSKIEELEAELSKVAKITDSKVEDVGFGIKVLKIMIIVPDSEGGDMEEKLSKVKGVSQVQVEEVTLV
jgi:translation elongation factor aEF-1 beta